MLSNKQFYHRTTRKLVILFGNIFNNLKMVRYNNAGTVEIERITVPLAYASKEKFYKRITQDIELTKEVQITLPRMAFEVSSLSYDPLRKISSQIDNFSSSTSSTAKNFKMTPYNFDFNLYIFARNSEDGMQIIEQILPYFTPDYTVTANFLNFNDLRLDVPLVLNSVTYDDSYEGDAESTRVITWTLNFTFKAYIFGPISDVSIIRKSNVNFYNYRAPTTIEMEFWQTPNTMFKTDELVYQGSSLQRATASGYVQSYSNNKIVLYDTEGVFKANSMLYGLVTNANANVSVVETTSNLIATIEVSPSPNTAGPTNAYGYDLDITEY